MFILNLFKRKKAFKNRNKGKEPPVLKAPEITPVPFPENAEIEILYMHYCGMAMGSHYILKKTDKGTFMKISSDSPDSYEMTMDKEGRQTTEERYSEFADIVKENEVDLLLIETGHHTSEKTANALFEAGVFPKMLGYIHNGEDVREEPENAIAVTEKILGVTTIVLKDKMDLEI